MNAKASLSEQLRDSIGDEIYLQSCAYRAVRKYKKHLQCNMLLRFASLWLSEV